MSRLHFEEARTEEQFAALSLIHALGWRTTYTGAIPADFMAREITDDRWVPTFRENLKTNRNQLLLLYDEDIPSAVPPSAPPGSMQVSRQVRCASSTPEDMRAGERSSPFIPIQTIKGRAMAPSSWRKSSAA